MPLLSVLGYSRIRPHGRPCMSNPATVNKMACSHNPPPPPNHILVKYKSAEPENLNTIQIVLHVRVHSTCQVSVT